MQSPARLPARAGTTEQRGAVAEPALPTVAEVFATHFDFVWRSARRLGVPAAYVDDVVQEVFVAVHRQLASFEGRSSLRTWLFCITRRVVANYRRSRRRKPLLLVDPNVIAERTAALEDGELTAHDSTRLLHALLDQLDQEKREVFVLSELEQMSGSEIAQALDISVSCAYARIRVARIAAERALSRLRARQRRAP